MYFFQKVLQTKLNILYLLDWSCIVHSFKFHLFPEKLGVFCEQRGYFNAKDTLEIFFLAKKKKKKVQSFSLWWLGGLPAGCRVAPTHVRCEL